MYVKVMADMIFSRDYSRAILTLRQDEGQQAEGFGGIFGRAVVEIRNNRARVMVYAQGLKNGCICSLYFICRKGEDFIPLKAVLVNIKNSRAEIRWEFNPDNILGSGFRIEDTAAMVILTEKGESILSAYFDRPVKWRNSHEVKAAEVCEALPAEDIISDDAVEDEAFDEAEAAEVPRTEEKSEGTEPLEKSDEAVNEKPNKEIVDFTQVVNRFRKDLDELRRYAYMERLDREEAREAAKNRRSDFNTEYLYDNRDKCCPFEDDSTEYFKIGLKDLSLIDSYLYKYANNPSVICAYLEFGHLLLGKDAGRIFLLMPENSKTGVRSKADMGFSEYREGKDGLGYRVLEINKEN